MRDVTNRVECGHVPAAAFELQGTVLVSAVSSLVQGNCRQLSLPEVYSPGASLKRFSDPCPPLPSHSGSLFPYSFKVPSPAGGWAERMMLSPRAESITLQGLSFHSWKMKRYSL